MKIIAVLLFIIFAPFLLYGQEIVGNWQGVISVQNVKLRIVFHIKKQPSGYSTTMDSPDQNAFGLPIEITAVTQDTIKLQSPKIGIKYIANFDKKSNHLIGNFFQGPYKLPLELAPEVKKDSTIVRPQEPAKLNYLHEDVMFENKKDNVNLSGTLTMPYNKRPSKIVVLISGSGPQNRDEGLTQFHQKPFLVWSDWLTKNNVAILRYDDRGVGKSTGDFANSTTNDFANDAEAAIDYIKSRSDLKSLPLGLLGHSEGGLIASMLASRSKSVNFIILIAAPGVPVRTLLLHQLEDQLQLSNIPEETIKKKVKSNDLIFNTIINNKYLPSDSLRNVLEHTLTTVYDSLRNEEKEQISREAFFKQTENQVLNRWFINFINIDPKDYLTQIKCPVLALDGTLDKQVRSEENLAAIKKDLEIAKNPDVQIMNISGLNHLLQTAKTGSTLEYGEIAETVSPIALKTVTDWLSRLP